MHITAIGLDLAKHWFQIHGVDAAGKVAVKRRLRRTEVVGFFRKQVPCLVGMEACATAHHWARELIAASCSESFVILHDVPGHRL
jgi:transposase